MIWIEERRWLGASGVALDALVVYSSMRQLVYDSICLDQSIWLVREGERVCVRESDRPRLPCLAVNKIYKREHVRERRAETSATNRRVCK